MILRRRSMMSSSSVPKIAKLVFDNYKSSPNISGDINSDAIVDIIGRRRRCLCKKVAEGEAAIAYLQNDNSNFYEDGTPAKLDGTEGDVMTYIPKIWYDLKALGKSSEVIISTKEIEGYVLAYESLLSVYPLCNISNKAYSHSGVLPATKMNFEGICTNRGKGYQYMDFEQYCMILLLFCAKYGERSNVGILGNSLMDVQYTKSGNTNLLGNTDTNIGTGEIYSNLFGLESIVNGGQMWLYNSKTTMGNPSTIYPTTTITDPVTKQIILTTSSLQSTEYAYTELRSMMGLTEYNIGKHFNMIPISIGISADVYYKGLFGRPRVFYNQTSFIAVEGTRSSNKSIFSMTCTRDEMDYTTNRLAFYGKINQLTPAEFKALPVK